MSEFNDIEILLIEDNPYDADLTIRQLKKNNLANKLVWLKDGAEALDLLFGEKKGTTAPLTQRPKVVLLDLKLPKVDGLEVLQQIKSHPHTASIPVVVLTSSDEEPDIEKCYQLGANSYIVKPVDFESFSNAVAQLGFYWLLLNQMPR